MNNCIKSASELDGKTVLFLGDSITDGGTYVSLIQTYFRLYLPKIKVDFRNLGVCSETVSGLSEPDHPFQRPCVLGRIGRILEEIHPDLVVTCYGINDGIYYPFSQEFLKEYQMGYTQLVDIIHKCGAKVAVMTPPPFDTASFQGELAQAGEEKYSFMKPYKKYGDVMKRYADWIRKEMPQKADCVIDIYTALVNENASCQKYNLDYSSGDGIHPNMHGHFIMADSIMRELFYIHAPKFETLMKADDFSLANMQHQRDDLRHCTDKETIGHDNEFKAEYLEKSELEVELAKRDKEIDQYISKHNELLNQTSEWCGFTEYQFHMDGYEAGVVKPKTAAEGCPYAWRTEFFGAFPTVDLELLKAGWHIVYLSIPNRYGGNFAVSEMAKFQTFVEDKFDLNSKAVLFGFSRGGLYAIHYAAAFPKRIAALYLDAPAVDINSWPGRCKDASSPREWADCLSEFDLTKATSANYAGILAEACKKLTENKFPLIIVAGESDEVVPFEENGKLLCDVYEEAKVPYKLILKPGVGHHPHSLENPQPITEFLVENI